VNQWRRKTAKGDVIVVRYADDAVLGFEHRNEADALLEELRAYRSSDWNYTRRGRD
jgi:hypothetical protein